MSVQIIGGNLDLAFEELNILAVKKFEAEQEYGGSIQVWELSNEELSKLNSVADDNWKFEYGWWRNGGTNCENDEQIEFVVNGEKMIGFKNEHSWYHSDDYLEELDEGEEPELPEYSTFFDWFTEYYGLSKLENVAYFVHSLAEINELTKAEFFEKYGF